MAQRAAAPNYYEKFLTEREEIHRYKWLQSEREGADIGFERALTEWVARHREDWLRDQAAKTEN